MRRHLEFWLKATLALGMLLLITACSRTVTWEEEVRLNTGETIWAERSVPWRLQGGFGNPFDIDLRPDVSRQVLTFNYRGKEYVYSGGAAVRWIAITGQQTPVLVATPGDWGWAAKNDFYCVVPYYVQLVPDATGKKWALFRPIEPWLHGLAYNVMGNFPRLNESRKRRYFIFDREKRDAVRRTQYPESTVVLPNYRSDSCIVDPALLTNKSLPRGSK